MNSYILIGPPGCGKSTWAKNFKPPNGSDSNIISSDVIRLKICGDISDQSRNREVFQKFQEEYVSLLARKADSIIVDATNMTRRDRKFYIDYARMSNYSPVAIRFDFDRQKLIYRIQERSLDGGLYVPTEAIDRMIAKYQPPELIEGFDSIYYVAN